MEHPKKPSRRQMIQGVGAAAIAGPMLSHTPLWGQSACAVLGSPSLTEGPYFVDEDMNRRDIRIDPFDGSLQAGIPLSLAINVQQINTGSCTPTALTGAYVDIWHCNALGVYSDVAAQGSTGRKYLRGYQPTDRQGNVYFVTVYPGWYQGRAVHIHIKVRIFNGPAETYEFTSQFFFDESFTDEVYRAAPYNTKGARDTRNTSDGIYSGSSSTGTITTNSGSYLLLTARNKTSWIEADAKLICDLSLGSSPDQSGGGGAPGGGGPGGPGGGMPPPGGGMPPGIPPGA